MNEKRGLALITAIFVAVLCLAVALILTTLATGNSQTVGNAYQKQQYYNVAEAGIDRGLRDMDSSIPIPGASGFLSATPTPPAAPNPGTTQTPLPNVPNVPYSYSYWFNASGNPTSTPDPLAGTFGVPSTNVVNVPRGGAVIWSQTKVGMRDVAVEAVVSRFSTGGGSCALCAGQGITLNQNQACGGGNCATPPPECKDGSSVDKICTDPAPTPTPTFVPVITGGTYSYPSSGSGCTFPCAYGDGNPTPNPTTIQQNASATTVASFLSSQGPVDQLSDASAWQAIANGSTIKYLDCTGGCSAATLNNNMNNPATGQITYVKGNIDSGTWGGNSPTVTYSGIFITECVSLSGNSTFQGNGPSAETIVWGTDAQCGGNAVSTSGNSFWNGGTAYAANGSVTISGTGRSKYVIFYGAIVAAGTITLTGNGNFSWDSALRASVLNFGPYAVDSFAQY